MTSASKSTATFGIALYGIVPGHRLGSLNLPWVRDEEGAMPSSPLEGRMAGRLGVIFRRVDLAWVNAEVPMAETVTRALRHEQDLETILAASPLIPFRFGTVLSGWAPVEEWVQARDDAIADWFSRAGEFQEWSVKVLWDADEAVRWMLAHEDEWIKKVQALPASPGARFLKEKQLLRDAHQAVRGVRSRIIRAVGELVRDLAEPDWPPVALAVSAAPSAPAPRENAAQPETPRNLEVIAHHALFLSPDGVDRLARDFSDLAAVWTDWGAVWERVGPWPPFHYGPTRDDATDNPTPSSEVVNP